MARVHPVGASGRFVVSQLAVGSSRKWMQEVDEDVEACERRRVVQRSHALAQREERLWCAPPCGVPRAGVIVGCVCLRVCVCVWLIVRMLEEGRGSKGVCGFGVEFGSTVTGQWAA